MYNIETVTLVSPELTSVTRNRFYSVIDCIPHIVHYIPMSYLYYNCKTVLLNPLHLLCPSLGPPPLWKPAGSLHLRVCAVFPFILLFLDEALLALKCA